MMRETYGSQVLCLPACPSCLCASCTLVANVLGVHPCQMPAHSVEHKVPVPSFMEHASCDKDTWEIPNSSLQYEFSQGNLPQRTTTCLHVSEHCNGFTSAASETSLLEQGIPEKEWDMHRKGGQAS